MDAGGPVECPPPGHAPLGRVLLEQPEVFAYGSIQQVGHRCGVDSVAVLRFSQWLGYSGYRALQAAVRAALPCRPGTAPGRQPAPVAETVRRLEAVRAHHQGCLDQAHRQIQPADLDRAATLLLQARRALVTGAGMAAGVAGILGGLLRDAGVPADELAAPSAAPLAQAGPGDVVVGIDLDGLRDPHGALDCARLRGAATIEITAAVSPSHAACEGLTLVAQGSGPGRGISAVAALAVVEMIAAEVAGRAGRRCEPGQIVCRQPLPPR
jgi:DNA-binding MurR/RpiR family transcriptional regulator